MRLVARKYLDFPLFSTPEGLLNALSVNMPLLLLAHHYGTATTGYYGLAFRVLQLPVALVLAALRQVLFQKASEARHEGADTYALFKKVTFGLLAIGAVPMLIFMLFAPLLFSIVFGGQWREAGEYARWLAIWTAVVFAETPANLFYRIYRRQGTLVVQQLLSFVCRLAALVVGGLYFSPLGTVILYSLVGAVFTAFVIAWMWWFLKTQVVKEAVV